MFCGESGSIAFVHRLASNPVDDAGLLSFATFSWLTPIMIKGYKHDLTVDTLPPLSPYDSSDINAKRYAWVTLGEECTQGNCPMIPLLGFHLPKMCGGP